MTKKDFVAIAQVIKDARDASAPPRLTDPYNPGEGVREQQARLSKMMEHSRIFDSLSRSMADVLAKQNARFDRDKFLETCGVEGY